MSSVSFTSGVAPGALPLVGHAWQLLREPHKFLDALPEYGDLVEIRLGPTRAYVPTHPELLRQVLIDDRSFDKGGAMFERTRDFFGNGLGTCPHQEHRRQRRLMTPAFHSQQMERYARVMTEEIGAMTDSWRDGQELDLFPELYSLSLRILTRTLFPADVSTEMLTGVQDAAEIVFGGAVRRIFTPEALHKVPTRANRRYDHALKHLHSTVDHIISDRRRSGENDGRLLSILVAGRDDGDRPGLSDEEIRDQVTTLILAGSEPVATVVSWALYEITRNPEIERRLQHEVDTVLKGRPAQLADLPNLPFTDRVFTEGMRLHPPAWMFSRVTTTPVEMAGRRIPVGATIVFSTPVIHRNAGLYENAQVFDPDRWLPERAAGLPRGAFPAFGAGARKCIGADYGESEAKMVLATIMNRWRPRPARGMDVRPTTISIIHHPRRLSMRLTRRPSWSGSPTVTNESAAETSSGPNSVV
jgi:pentalenene oxygenase